jgi:hypothetical protein
MSASGRPSRRPKERVRAHRGDRRDEARLRAVGHVGEARARADPEIALGPRDRSPHGLVRGRRLRDHAERRPVEPVQAVGGRTEQDASGAIELDGEDPIARAAPERVRPARIEGVDAAAGLEADVQRAVGAFVEAQHLLVREGLGAGIRHEAPMHEPLQAGRDAGPHGAVTHLDDGAHLPLGARDDLVASGAVDPPQRATIGDPHAAPLRGEEGGHVRRRGGRQHLDLTVVHAPDPRGGADPDGAPFVDRQRRQGVRAAIGNADRTGQHAAMLREEHAARSPHDEAARRVDRQRMDRLAARRRTHVEHLEVLAVEARETTVGPHPDVPLTRLRDRVDRRLGQPFLVAPRRVHETGVRGARARGGKRRERRGYRGDQEASEAHVPSRLPPWCPHESASAVYFVRTRAPLVSKVVPIAPRPLPRRE